MTRAHWIAQQHGRKAVLYVIRLYGNEGEAPFYKIGITFCLTSRFRSLRFAGYKWRTVARYGNWNAAKVFDLEQQLHADFSALSYTPLLAFAGHTECYCEVGPLLAALPSGAFILKSGIDI